MTRPVIRRQELTITERQTQVARLWTEKQTMREIAAELDCSLGTVSNDVRKIHAHWVATTIQEFDVRLAAEIATINAVERQAWEAYRTSLQDAVEQTEPDSESSGKTVTKRRKKKWRSTVPGHDPSLQRTASQASRLVRAHQGRPDRRD